MGRKHRRFGGFLAIMVMLGVSFAQAETITLDPVKDNTLIENPMGALSLGVGPSLFAGRTSQPFNSTRRGLVAFDVAGNIPAGSTIVSVTLSLTTASNSSGSTNTALHRVTSDWGEGTSGANAVGGQGVPATPGDATWKHTFYDTDTWTQLGGDFEPESSASTPVIGVGLVSWASTSGLIGDVQAWLDAPATNYGWALTGDETVGGTSARFATRENEVEADRPRLTVEFLPGASAIPTMSQWGMVIMFCLLASLAKIVLGTPHGKSARL